MESTTSSLQCFRCGTTFTATKTLMLHIKAKPRCPRNKAFRQSHQKQVTNQDSLSQVPLSQDSPSYSHLPLVQDNTTSESTPQIKSTRIKPKSTPRTIPSSTTSRARNFAAIFRLLSTFLAQTANPTRFQHQILHRGLDSRHDLFVRLVVSPTPHLLSLASSTRLNAKRRWGSIGGRGGGEDEEETIT